MKEIQVTCKVKTLILEDLSLKMREDQVLYMTPEQVAASESLGWAISQGAVSVQEQTRFREVRQPQSPPPKRNLREVVIRPISVVDQVVEPEPKPQKPKTRGRRKTHV